MEKSSPSAERLDRNGLAATAAAFLIWGLFPLYIRQLQTITALQIMGHRILWGCVSVVAYLTVRGQLRSVWAVFRQPKMVLQLTITALLVSINWLTYVWAVNNHHVVETSLGYFINPLVNVLLGVVLLSERLNRTQWTAVAFAAAGVLYLAIAAGQPPWISLGLALSFGLYGFVRKIIAVDPLPGLATETLLLLPVALLYLGFCQFKGIGIGPQTGGRTIVFLICSGMMTTIPLALFAYGGKLLPYSTVGLLQYIAPSMQLLIGITVFHESFTATRAVGFALIWIALVIYVFDSLWRSRPANTPAM